MFEGMVLSEFLDSLDWGLPAVTVLTGIVRWIHGACPKFSDEEAEEWAIDLVLMRYRTGG